MLNQLSDINDPLISMFRESELKPIKDNSAYHSPEVSETDEENQDAKRKIVTKDLKWRSTTVRLL
jgi:hypothetical protein